ncbi:unnamed protein product [Notodromas monacha]|uniref:Uncharacterized protein n=1 Tax=Notodromas monacha TaxID=399045 RepID=A0A7R9GBC8_9CRUS|nr:unnamed protein product [Notodromas monacha]CAG0916216.1 unnamed protein product [Notodromas monacha]
MSADTIPGTLRVLFDDVMYELLQLSHRTLKFRGSRQLKFRRISEKVRPACYTGAQQAISLDEQAHREDVLLTMSADTILGTLRVLFDDVMYKLLQLSHKTLKFRRSGQLKFRRIYR